MKITDSEVIKSGEKELIDALTADLDWGAIEEIFRKEHRLGIEEDVEYRKGDIVIHDNQVAYELEFEVKVTLSVLLDREGNYISLTSSGDLDKTQDENKDELMEEPEELDEEPEEKVGNDLEGSMDAGEDLQAGPGVDSEEEEGSVHEELTDTDGDLQTESDGSTEEEKAGNDIEGSVDTGGDLQTDNEPEKTPADDDVTESEDEYKEALAELDSTDNPENADTTQPMSPPEGSQEKISRMASQAGEMIAEINDEK